MNRIWINKANSFKEAKNFDDNYYLSMSAIERLETIQFLREKNNKIKGKLRHASRERLRRVIKIIQ